MHRALIRLFKLLVKLLPNRFRISDFFCDRPISATAKKFSVKTFFKNPYLLNQRFSDTAGYPKLFLPHVKFRIKPPFSCYLRRNKKDRFGKSDL